MNLDENLEAFKKSKIKGFIIFSPLKIVNKSSSISFYESFILGFSWIASQI